MKPNTLSASSSLKLILLIACCMLGNAMPVNAQVNILTQSFEVLPYPPAGWQNVRLTGPSLPGVWTRVTAGTYPVQAPHSGSYEIRYNSHNYLAGTTGDIRTQVLDFSTVGVYSVGFWMYRDSWSGDDKVEVYVNTVQTSVGGTLMGTINRDYNKSPYEVSNGWYHYYFTVPGGFTGTTNYIILKAYSQYGNDMYVDDITVDRLPPATPACISAFTPASGTTGYCTNSTLEWTSVTSASGYKLTLGSNSPTYNNVANSLDVAASLSYTTVLASLTTYGWKVVPYNAFGDASGCSFNLFTTGSSLCYCVPVYVDVSCTSEDYINDFYTTGGLTNISNYASGCTTNPDNYTHFAMSASAYQGGTFNVNMQSGPDYGQGYTVWVDWNQDGDFQDAGESVFSSAAATVSLVSGTVNVPVTATLGTTRLRVRCVYNYVPGSTNSCTTFTEGETEDYDLVITTPVLPITLADFYGVKNVGSVDLFWDTENEINSNYFLVEKSHDGRAFEVIAQIPAAGNSDGKIHYELTDNDPFEGVNYYQLMLVDMENIVRYSDIAVLDFNSAGEEGFAVYPNPATDVLHIVSSDNASDFNYTLFSVSGEEVLSATGIKTAADIDISALSKGMYIVHVFNDQNNYSQKVIIK